MVITEEIEEYYTNFKESYSNACNISVDADYSLSALSPDVLSLKTIRQIEDMMMSDIDGEKGINNLSVQQISATIAWMENFKSEIEDEKTNAEEYVSCLEALCENFDECVEALEELVEAIPPNVGAEVIIKDQHLLEESPSTWQIVHIYEQWATIVTGQSWVQPQIKEWKNLNVIVGNQDPE
jgi:hypothetical protein